MGQCRIYSKNIHIHKLKQCRKDYEKVIEQRHRDEEDMKILKEQNSEWMKEAKRELKRIEEKIEKAKRKRVVYVDPYAWRQQVARVRR